MDRLLEHFEEDPVLRGEYCGQESYDEYVNRRFSDPGFEADELGKLSADEVEEVMLTDWKHALHPKTGYVEILYLLGVTDKEKRVEAAGQMHALLLNGAVERGWFGTEVSDN